MTDPKEIIIKSKRRVQKHGEVFTPRHMVKMMLDQPGIEEDSRSLTSTFLEPSAGEGAFLIEILKRKLETVFATYNETLAQYERYSLFALTTLYGVELLEDNAQRCVMNLYQVYNDAYRQAAEKHRASTRNKIFRAAQYIISTNIVQGNFLTKQQTDEEPIVFSEWKLLKMRSNQKQLKVQRIEYTLEDIAAGIEHESGSIHGSASPETSMQLNLFELFSDDEEEASVPVYRYRPCAIEDVALEEMEEMEEMEETHEPHRD